MHEEMNDRILMDQCLISRCSINKFGIRDSSIIIILFSSHGPFFHSITISLKVSSFLITFTFSIRLPNEGRIPGSAN